MRRPLAFAGLVVLVASASAQPPSEVKIDPRFGIPGNARLFPQTDPKAALGSAVRAVEAGRYDYLVAHLLDDKFVEAKIAERAAQVEPAADADLRALRARQQADPRLDKATQLPGDPREFADAVKAEARQRAFRQVVQDVQDKFAEDATAAKELRRFAREGDFAAEGTTATAGLKAVKGRVVYIKKAGDRWFVENRTAGEK